MVYFVFWIPAHRFVVSGMTKLTLLIYKSEYIYNNSLNSHEYCHTIAPSSAMLHLTSG